MDSSSIRRSRDPYTWREDRSILRYLIETEDVAELGGNEVWKRLEKDKKYNLGGRTFHSLKERWRKTIEKSLDRYKLSEAEKELLLRHSKKQPRFRFKRTTHLDSSSDEERNLVIDTDAERDQSDDRNTTAETSETRRANRSEKREPPSSASQRADPRAAANSELDEDDEDERDFRCTRKKSTGARSKPPSTRVRNAEKKADASSVVEEDEHDKQKKDENSRSSGRKSTGEAQISMRRFFHQSSSPLLNRAAPLFSDSPPSVDRVVKTLNRAAARNQSIAAGPLRRKTPVSSERTGEEESRPDNPSGRTEQKARASPSISPEDESSPERPAENTVIEANQATELARRVRFLDEGHHDSGWNVSPVIETTPSRRKAHTRNEKDSDDSLRGLTQSAMLPEHDGSAVSTRTRSSRRTSEQDPSPIGSPRAAEAPLDDLHTSPTAMSSYLRVSSQDRLRGIVCDTQQESCSVISKKRGSQERKAEGGEGEGTSPKRSRSRTSVLAVSSADTPNGLILQMNVNLRFPEPLEDKNSTVVAFDDLIKTTIRKHHSWGPHSNCPGLHEFLYMCKRLRERVARASYSRVQREWIVTLIDQHLSDMFHMPLCTRNKDFKSIDCTGVHQYFLDDPDWSRFLRNLASLYEAQEILKDLDHPKEESPMV